MNASEIGSPDWFKVVGTMPPIEALEAYYMCRYLTLQKYAGKSEIYSVSHILTRCNDEIKLINFRLNEASWQYACREVLTPEQFDEVIVQKRVFEDMDHTQLEARRINRINRKKETTCP